MRNTPTFKNSLLLITYVGFITLIVMNFSQILTGFGNAFAIIAPIFYGLGIAFVLNLLMTKIEINLFKKAFRNISPKLQRNLSILLTYILFFTAIIIIFSLVLPELGQSIGILIDSVPGYLEELEDSLTDLIIKFNLQDIIPQTFAQIPWAEIGNRFTSFISDAMNNILSSTAVVTGAVVSAFMGFIISIYMLANKENFAVEIKKILVAYVPSKISDMLINFVQLCNNIFRKFIAGQITEAVLLGILCFIGMTLLSLPYAPLISTIIGITNIIPYFGPLLGTIPSVFLILMIDPVKALIFIIFILALQQIDSNLIYPRVVGDSMELPGIWVIVAIMIGGGSFGIVGMLFAVPVFAIIYTIIKAQINKKYEQKINISSQNTGEKP